MHLKGECELKEHNGKAGYGSPCLGDRALRDPYSSSHTGDRSKNAPGGSETP